MRVEVPVTVRHLSSARIGAMAIMGLPAGAFPYLITLPVGQAITASPAVESRLNRPRLKEELFPVGANVCARGIWRCDPEKQKSSIRVVGIGRDVTRDRRPRRFRRILRQPSLALHDPFQNLALGHALAC